MRLRLCWRNPDAMIEQIECARCRHVNAVVDAEPHCDIPCQRCGSVLGLCPQCGHLRSADAVICTHCGLDFRTGTRVVGSPRVSLTFGDFSIVPMVAGEWRLTMRTRFLGIGLGSQEFEVVGFNKVYYDTLDSWTRRLPPTASVESPGISFTGLLTLAIRTLKMAAPFFISIYFQMYYLWRTLGSSTNSDSEAFFFEVGLLGPNGKSLRLKQSPNSQKIRAIATWLSSVMRVPVERRDRRSPT
jgi:hypothetical protein